MELLDKYNELYAIMAQSAEPGKMHIFGEAEKWVFAQMVKSHPELANKWLERIEAVKWNNYLCESAAMDIVSTLINTDGSRGPKWSYSQVMSAVQSLGGNTEHEPYYNSYALFVLMNWVASNEWGVLSKVVPEDKLTLTIYQLAVSYLTDPDEAHFIQRYWGK